MKRDPAVYLHHIADECAFIMTRSEGLSKEEFLIDDLLKHAFVKAIEIIGEAVKNVPDRIREKYFHIDWNNIAGMRDRTVHAYFDINYHIVWDVIKNEVPQLKSGVEKILEDLG